MERTSLLIVSILIITINCSQIKDKSSYQDESSHRDDFICTEPGYHCSGCDKSYYCSRFGDELIAQLIEICPNNNRTCLKSTGQCTSNENPECTENQIDYKLTCRHTGMFPHPFKCDQYFICSELYVTPEPKECPDGFKYDPLTTLCNKKKDSCNPLLTPCEFDGQYGKIEGHSSMYYVCLPQLGNGEDSLSTPQLLLCPRDEVFLGPECSPLETGVNSDGKCVQSGIFHVPGDCKSFNVCSSNGIGDYPVNMVCDCGEKFYPDLKKCDLMSC